VNVMECAKLLDKSPQFVRMGLQLGILPFGVAIKMSSKWTYHISEAKVYEYLGKEMEIRGQDEGSRRPGGMAGRER
jgi:hypothetical protein